MQALGLGLVSGLVSSIWYLVSGVWCLGLGLGGLVWRSGLDSLVWVAVRCKRLNEQ